MLQLHFINLIYLVMLLAPGVIAGLIVTWHIRSSWAMFQTIFASLATSFGMGLVTVILGKLISPLLVDILGKWVLLIDFSQSPNPGGHWLGSLPYYILSYYRYSIIAPIGTVAGAALAGMLLVAGDRLRRSSVNLDSSLVLVANVASLLLGGLMSLVSILSLSWLGWQLIFLFAHIFGNQFFSTAFGKYAYYGVWGLMLLVNSLLCGLTSAFFGMKAARILT
jgi:hypothetical protein